VGGETDDLTEKTRGSVGREKEEGQTKTRAQTKEKTESCMARVISFTLRALSPHSLRRLYTYTALLGAESTWNGMENKNTEGRECIERGSLPNERTPLSLFLPLHTHLPAMRQKSAANEVRTAVRTTISIRLLSHL
jgi:hypothetical protein